MRQTKKAPKSAFLAVVFMLLSLLLLVMTEQQAYAKETEQDPIPQATYSPTCITGVCTPNTHAGCCPLNASVGGVVVSVNKFDLIAPYLGLSLAIITSAIVIGTAKHIKRRKTQQ